MSASSFLLIRPLDTTVPESFIHPDMRTDFREIVSRCQVTRRLSSLDSGMPPSEDRGLRPIAFNFIKAALTDDELLKRLQANSHRVGYWFFNIFLIPDSYNDYPPITPNIASGIIKDITKGLDHIK